MNFTIKRSVKRLRPSSTAMTAFQSSKSDEDRGRSKRSRMEPARLRMIDKLDEEGVSFAEEGKFEHALNRWNRALQLCGASLPLREEEQKKVEGEGEGRRRAVLYEQCAQVLLEMNRTFDAIVAAENAVKSDMSNPHGLLTLARAQLNHGELDMAVQSFQAAHVLSKKTKKYSTLVPEISLELQEAKTIAQKLKQCESQGEEKTTKQGGTGNYAASGDVEVWRARNTIARMTMNAEGEGWQGVEGKGEGGSNGYDRKD
ncbi:hypothetical protein AAMO2058_001709400 [Amorphochlora amoebiformis]